MNWYLAKLIFHINIDNGTHNTQFHESMRLVFADSAEHAIEQMRTIGMNESSSFVNSNGQLVQWTFVGVPHIHSLPSIENGVEVCSATHIETEPEIYIHSIEHTSIALIKNQNSNSIFQ